MIEEYQMVLKIVVNGLDRYSSSIIDLGLSN